MQLIKQSENLAAILASKLRDALSTHHHVIWLVPGGSNISISVEAMKLLDETLTERLVIMQTDERYVSADDPDCNWKQLRESGFDPKKATVYPVIAEETRSLEMTVSHYEETVHREFELADYIVGQFGIGADGHTAGIKPHSPATLTNAFVDGYQAEDFTRVTLTFQAIREINTIVAFAFGDDKRDVFEILAGDMVPSLEEVPAAILRAVADSTLYNDQIESEKSV